MLLFLPARLVKLESSICGGQDLKETLLAHV
jgi:hypothetical protein